MFYKIDPDLIAGVINTLKQIDVRGYDSMDKLVALVCMFQHILETAPETEATVEPRKGEE